MSKGSNNSLSDIGGSKTSLNGLAMSWKSSRKESAGYLFKYLVLANFLQYLEAGAVPALLLTLANDFDMPQGQQGLLGGVVYVALSFGSPLAGYFLRHYDHRTVVGTAVLLNNFFTFIWAFTPVQHFYSKPMFILVRFIMGVCQCVLCVFLPLWINEFAPSDRRTRWMGFLQASVPFGIMAGYIIATIVTGLSKNSVICGGIYCWRWPFLIEVFLVFPLSVAFNFVPRKHINVRLNANESGKKKFPRVREGDDDDENEIKDIVYSQFNGQSQLSNVAYQSNAPRIKMVKLYHSSRAHKPRKNHRRDRGSNSSYQSLNIDDSDEDYSVTKRSLDFEDHDADLYVEMECFDEDEQVFFIVTDSANKFLY
jgi:hypothetical protein